PARIAHAICDGASSCVPAPCCAVVSSDLSGQLTVLAERGLMPEMGPAVYAVAGWVMQRGTEFVTADLRHDPRVPEEWVATVVAFPLSCRGRHLGSIVRPERNPAARDPQVAAAGARQRRAALQPAAGAPGMPPP